MGSYSSLQIALNAPERARSMTLAAVGSGSNLENLDAFRAQCRANAEQYETIGSAEVAKVTREAPSRIPFLLKDPRGHADFYAALARHDAKGSANTMRSFQGGRPSIYTMTEAIRRVPTPALILCGDEDDNCIAPSLFLKKHLPAGDCRSSRSPATCSISRNRRCSTRWSSGSSRWSRPAAGRRAIRGQ
jgi:proline iminopeptidase